MYIEVVYVYRTSIRILVLDLDAYWFYVRIRDGLDTAEN
jgi:hypothetical protein